MSKTSETTAGTPDALLRVRGLTHTFSQHRLFRSDRGSARALDDVSFDVLKGECFGIVGESGAGKTTLARALLRTFRPDGGTVELTLDGTRENVLQARPQKLRRLRREMQMIFQDPQASLNPRMTVAEIVAEPLVIHGTRDRRILETRVRQLLIQTGLNPKHLDRYPHAFSGGQRQRIAIARALALKPRLLIADEPVSALDPPVRAQILNLFQELRRDLGLTILLITHDLRVVRHICDRVAVMHRGTIVELKETDSLFANPTHPHTVSLLTAIPRPDPSRRHRRFRLQASAPLPENQDEDGRRRGRDYTAG